MKKFALTLIAIFAFSTFAFANAEETAAPASNPAAPQHPATESNAPAGHHEDQQEGQHEAHKGSKATKHKKGHKHKAHKTSEKSAE